VKAEPEVSVAVSTAGPPAPRVEAPPRLEIHIPLRTFLKIFAALLCAYAAYVLWPLLLLVFLALFLAVTLNALVDWLEARRMPHWGSLTLVIGSLLTMLGAGLAFLAPALFDQAAVITDSLPGLWDDILSQLPVSGSMRQNLEGLIERSNGCAAEVMWS